MLIGFLYQLGNPPIARFAPVNMKAAMNLYMNQFREVSNNEGNVVCKWKVYSKKK